MRAHRHDTRIDGRVVDAITCASRLLRAVPRVCTHIDCTEDHNCEATDFVTIRKDGATEGVSFGGAGQILAVVASGGGELIYSLTTFRGSLLEEEEIGLSKRQLRLMLLKHNWDGEAAAPIQDRNSRQVLKEALEEIEDLKRELDQVRASQRRRHEQP